MDSLYFRVLCVLSIQINIISNLWNIGRNFWREHYRELSSGITLRFNWSVGCPTLLFIGAKHNISMASLFYSCGLLINISYCAFSICALETFLARKCDKKNLQTKLFKHVWTLKTRDRAVPYRYHTLKTLKACVKV